MKNEVFLQHHNYWNHKSVPYVTYHEVKYNHFNMIFSQNHTKNNLLMRLAMQKINNVE